MYDEDYRKIIRDLRIGRVIDRVLFFGAASVMGAVAIVLLLKGCR